MDYTERLSETNGGSERLLSSHDLLRFVRRRRKTIAFTTLAFLALGGVYCLTAKRRYRAEALIEIRQPEDTLGINHLVQGTVQEVQTQQTEATTIATKVAELQSYQLALRVITELGLENDEDFKPKSSLTDTSSDDTDKESPSTKLEDSPKRRDRAVRTFLSHLQIKNTPGTRLISVSYADLNPDTSAKIVNQLAADLALNSFSMRQASVSQMSGWLKKQLQTVKEQADKLEAEEAQTRRQTQSYTLSGVNAGGQTQVYSPILDQLQQITQSLSTAEQNRILRGAIQQIAQTHDPKLLSGLAGSALSNGNPQNSESLDVIRTLQQQIDTVRATLARDELRYGDANPKLVQDRANLQALEDSVKAESDRMLARANNDFQIANQQANLARSERDQLMQRASQLNDEELKYEVIHLQARDARQLYSDLNSRISEAGVLAGMQADDTAVVSRAFAPGKPTSPKVPLTLVASIILGLVFGVSLAGLREILDDTFTSPVAIESEARLPVYSVLPRFGRVFGRGKGENVSNGLTDFLESPGNDYAGAMRILRSAVQPDATSSRRSILVAGSGAGVGASTTALNLAATFARAGTRTLIVETDVSDAGLAARTGHPVTDEGLSRMLAGELSSEWSLQVDSVPGLYCIPVGRHSAAFHDLIGSGVMAQLLREWKQRYDVVLLDGGALLPSSDALQVSRFADVVLIVARDTRTTLHSLRAAYKLLSRQSQASVGVVLNGAGPRSDGFYDFYGYRNGLRARKQMEEV